MREEYIYPRCEQCKGKATHPQRHITDPTRSMCVDEGVADLVLACWRSGIMTTESCQDMWGDGKYAWLSFEAAVDYEMFPRLLMSAPSATVEMISRITGFQPVGTSWDWTAIPIERYDGPAMMYSVDIPVTDVVETVRLLTAQRS